MERKKLPSETDLDALIEAAISQSDEHITDTDLFDTDVLAFLSHYKLAEGPYKINAALLYRIYKVWSKNHVKQNKFSTQMALYIPRQSRYYLINKDSSEVIADLSDLFKKKKPPATRKRANWEHFKAFLNAYQVSSGTEWVEDYVICHFYDKWLYQKKRKKRLSNTAFLRFLKTTFETRQTNDGYVMKISHNFEKPSEQNIREAWKRKTKGPK